ncbi:MAG: LysR family transcriptional regulator [Oscillospiraceae bacterium]|nr:LysR family transcriptional regulator [Oscillospiraceae bacterium]
MELNQLQYFRVVAQTQNITAAAERLHIAQPTLSKVIKRLEEDLGFQLFDRRSSRLTLNPLGEAYLVYVELALDALARGRQCLMNMKTGTGNEIRLAATFDGVPNLMIEQFAMFHPEHSITAVRVDPDEVLTLLLNDHVDFALTLSSQEHLELEVLSCLVEPLLLIIPSGMQPFNNGSCTHLTDYQHERFAIFEGDKDQYDTFLRCCNQAEFVPIIVYRSTRTQKVHSLVERLNACTLMPALIVLQNWENLPEETRRHVQMVDEPRCNRAIYLYRHRKEHPSEELDAFADFSVRFFRNMDEEITRLLTKCFPGKEIVKEHYRSEQS